MLRNLNHLTIKRKEGLFYNSLYREVCLFFLKWGVSLGGAAASADLGGSSKYSNENFED
jgi:hypothetical protein